MLAGVRHGTALRLAAYKLRVMASADQSVMSSATTSSRWVADRESAPGSDIPFPQATEPAQDYVLRAALAVGVALRAVLYLSGRSLWIDEARLALNIAGRGYGGLLRPLDYDQAAPPLFLWTEKLATDLFGVHDLVLRALPFAAGVAALFLFARVAGRLLSGWPAVVAVAALALAPALVFYSAELKPYAVDLAVSLVLIYATMTWVERPDARLARLLPWFGALSVWASAPAMFVLPTTAAAMLLSGRENVRATLERMRLALLAWPISMALAYVAVYRPASHNDYLHWYWNNSFLAVAQHERVARATTAARDVIWGLTVGAFRPPIERFVQPPELYALTGYAVLVLAILALIGIGAVLRSWRPWQSALLLGPACVLVCASAMSLYPLSLRLVLLLGPALYLLLAAGADRALFALPGWARRPPATLAAGGFLGLQLVNSVSWVARAPKIEAVRPMADAFERLRRPSESIYLNAGSLPAWVFYTTDWSRPDRERLRRFAALASSGAIGFENDGPRGPRPPDDGAALRFSSHAWTEMLGVASGYEGRAATAVKPHMDPGWFGNELSRIAAEGCGRGVWVLLSHSRAPDLLLLSGLEVAGGRATFRLASIGSDASLSRLEFGDASGGSCGR